MQIVQLLLIIFSITLTNQMFCNFYPLDSIACVSKTEGIKCYYNQFESSCMDTQSTSHGCQPTLNELACLNQLTNTIGEEVRCSFGKKCIAVKSTHLKKIGCSKKFSKYSCTNVYGKSCIWNNNQCTEYFNNIPEGDSCEVIFGDSVTPSLCSKIENLKCMNGGFQQDYKCISVNEQLLFKLKCTDLGINQPTCISITTSNQKCMIRLELMKLYLIIIYQASLIQIVVKTYNQQILINAK